jgi:hypothetical protein
MKATKQAGPTFSIWERLKYEAYHISQLFVSMTTYGISAVISQLFVSMTTYGISAVIIENSPRP